MSFTMCEPSATPLGIAKPTQALHELGQSLWLDNITRKLISTGTLAGYIKDLSVTGLTSNPTIFEQTLSNSADYDRQIDVLAAAGMSDEEIFFELALEDLTAAADLLRPRFDASGGLDGWVSLEVSPLLADNATQTLEAAKKLCSKAATANLLIKNPGYTSGTAGHRGGSVWWGLGQRHSAVLMHPDVGCR